MVFLKVSLTKLTQEMHKRISAHSCNDTLYLINKYDIEHSLIIQFSECLCQLWCLYDTIASIFRRFQYQTRKESNNDMI